MKHLFHPGLPAAVRHRSRSAITITLIAVASTVGWLAADMDELLGGLAKPAANRPFNTGGTAPQPRQQPPAVVAASASLSRADQFLRSTAWLLTFVFEA
jgi:hypothetical protein